MVSQLDCIGGCIGLSTPTTPARSTGVSIFSRKPLSPNSNRGRCVVQPSCVRKSIQMNTKLTPKAIYMSFVAFSGLNF